MTDETHALLEQLLEAVDRALWESSPDAQISARSDARRLWVELTRSVDREGVLSEAYRERANADAKTEEETAAEEETEKRKFALNVAAQMLCDLGGKNGAFKGPVASGLGMVGGSIIDILLERKGTGTFKPMKRGGGNRERSVAVDRSAWPKFVRLAHYKGKRDGGTVEESVLSLGVGWSAFKAKQQTISEQARKTARDAGEAVWAGGPLTPDEQAVVDDCEAILTDPERLKKLKSAIFEKFDRSA